ncbi:MAG TPA: CcdB family protein [Steroidobacteraceae bacterium]|jgi:toxin CcdB|nr:CcdB family protein [Steroidobacteraceae bacterium]
MMIQFDVFQNPITRARTAYPLVVVLQSDATSSRRNVIVAPLVPSTALAKVAGRLTPIVSIDGQKWVVLVPSLAGVRGPDLGKFTGSLAGARDALLAAVDFLFFGV